MLLVEQTIYVSLWECVHMQAIVYVVLSWVCCGMQIASL